MNKTSKAVSSTTPTNQPITETRVREIVKEELAEFGVKVDKKFDAFGKEIRTEMQYEFAMMRAEMKKMFDEQNDFISNMMSGFMETMESWRVQHEAGSQRLSLVEKKTQVHEKRLLKIEKKIFA